MVSKHVCSNYDDDDPISLEPVKTLKHFFYLSCPRSGRVEACDSIAWLRYFARSDEKWPTHPCTRQMLNAQDIWDCYANALNALGPDDADIMAMRRDTVTAKVVGRTVAMRATSPLFLICLKSIQTVSESDPDTKTIEIRYSMAHSAHPNTNMLVTNKHVRVQVPKSFSISIGR